MRYSRNSYATQTLIHRLLNGNEDAALMMWIAGMNSRRRNFGQSAVQQA